MTGPAIFRGATRRASFLGGRVELYLGDCIEILGEMPQLGVRSGSIITDPPYEAHMHNAKQGARGLRTDGYAEPAAVGFASIDGVRERFMPLAARACWRWFVAFCTPEGIAPWRDAIEAAGARYKRACFWVKPDSAPQFNGQGPAMAVEAFVTAWCGEGLSNWNGGGRRNYFTHPTNNPDRHGAHPTEKPVSLMSEIVHLFTELDEEILDPFMGSGTTGVASIKAGRRFVGIESDPAYFDIACERIGDAASRPDLFVEAALKEQQHGLFTSPPEP